MSNIPKTKKRSWNGELSAMSKMWNLLEPMSHLQRRRILAWLTGRAEYGDQLEFNDVTPAVNDLNPRMVPLADRLR
jgi:hypothetical protein